MLRKILGKTLDYFFGFGDKRDYYNIATEYNWAFSDEDTQRIENFSLKTEKLAKIMVRNIVNLLQAVSIYYVIVNKNPKSLFVIPILEAPRILSAFADYENKKRILKKKEKALDICFNPKQAEGKRDKRNNYSDMDNADWWKD